MIPSLLSRRLAAVVAALLLAACGGGGGGSSSTAPVNPNPPVTPPPPTVDTVLPVAPFVVTKNGYSVQVERGSVRMVGMQNNIILPVQIGFTLQSSPPGAPALYVRTVTDRPDIMSLYPNITSSTAMSVGVDVHSQPAATALVGNITVDLCADENCAKVVWTASVPFQVKVFAIASPSLTLTGFQGATTVDTSTMITPADTRGELVVTNVSSGLPAWLSAHFNSASTLEVTAAAGSMPLGRYTGIIKVGPRDSAQFSRDNAISVSFTTSVGLQLPANQQAVYNLASAPTTPGSIPVTFNGGQSPAWTATSDRPWLIIDTPQGTGNGTLAYHIDNSKLGAVANYGTDSASITVKPAQIDAASVSVTVTKQLPELSSIVPAMQPSSTPGVLRVRGRGLQQLPGAASFHIDGVPVVTGTIASDTEARLDLPALNAGAHSVNIPAADQLTAPRKEVLSVLAPTTFSAAYLAATGNRAQLLYNPTRKALFMVDQMTWTLERYDITAGGLVKAGAVVLPWGTSIGQSLNGETLYTTSPTGGIDERNPDSLAVRASYGSGQLGSQALGILQVTNDNRIWFPNSLGYFDTTTKTFGNVNASVPVGMHYASADGSRMFSMPDAIGSERNFSRYDPDSGRFDAFLNSVYMGPRHLALSADGKWVVSNFHVVYNALNIQDLAPGSSENSNEQQFLSRDGTRLYVTVVDYTPLRVATIRVFDVVNRVTLGDIYLPSGVGVCDYACYFRGSFAMSDDEKAFFWAANSGIAVIPIPANLAPQPAPAPRLRKSR